MTNGVAFRATRWLLAGLGFVVAFLVAESAYAWDALAWNSPEQARVFRWEDSRLPAMLLRVVDPKLDTELRDQELFLSPVKPGQEVRIFGDPVEVGFGSGSQDLPDVISWQTPGRWLRQVASGLQELRMPTYESARWVVVRPLRPKTKVRLEVAVPEVSNILWYRAEEDVWSMLNGGPPPTLSAPLASHQSEIRFLDAARRAFPPGVGRELLQARWLEYAWQERSLARPYFVPAPLRTIPVARPAMLQADGSVLAALPEGQRLEVYSDEAEVITLLVRARAVGQIRVVVNQGGALAAVMRQDIARNAEDPYRSTAAARFRLTIAPGTPLSIQVQRGSAEFSLLGFRARPSITDGTPFRQRTQLLRSASEIGGNSIEQRTARTLSELALCRCPLAFQKAQLLLPATTGRLRALVLFELIYQGIGLLDVGALLPQFWGATAGLEQTDRLAFRRQLLQRLADADAELPEVERLDEAAVPAGLVETETLSEDAFATAALAAMLAPPRDGSRPRFAAAAEIMASRSAERGDLSTLSRRTWFRTPWSWVDPSDGQEAITRVRDVYGARPYELCESQGERGSRWLELGQAPETFAIRADMGTHARVMLRGEDEVPAPDSAVNVDGTQVFVHSGAGVSSSVALAAGSHQIHVLGGPKVLAQLPLAKPVACGRMRELERWVPVRQSVRFSVTPGEVGTIGRILVDLEQTAPKLREIAVRAENQVYRAWFRAPATGALAFPLSKNGVSFEVHASMPMLVRALARLNKLPEAPPRRTVVKADAASNEALLLAQVRNTTLLLRTSKTAEARALLRLARATALEDLGYLRLAAVDRLRANEPEVQPEPGDGTSAWMDLAPGSPEVIPLNLASRIPLLPLPIPNTALERAFAERRTGAPPAELVAILAPSAGTSSGEDALLLAVLAERLGLLDVSAAAYERIGQALQSGPLLAHAARLRADLAAKEQSHEQTMAAYILAREAEAAAASVGDVFARMDRAIDWIGVTAQGAAGTRWLEHESGDDSYSTLGERVRRALVAASPEARSLGRDPVEISLLGLSSRNLHLRSVCQATDGPSEYCLYQFKVDAHPVTCSAMQATPLGRDHVAQPMECDLELPEGAARLTVIPPEEREVVGWIEIQEQTSSGLSSLIRTTRWTEIDAPRPMEFDVVGPTVLQIQSRGVFPAPSSFSVGVAAPDAPTTTQEYPVSPAIDALARFRDVRSQVTAAGREYMVLPKKGVYRIRISTPSGRVLLKVEAALAKGLPRERPEVAPIKVPPQALGGSVAWRTAWPAIGVDRGPGWLTLSAFSSYVDPGLLDEDTASSEAYAELGVGAGRAVIPGTLFGAVTLARRLRSGSDSSRATSSWSLGGGNGLPGAWLNSSFTFQQLQELHWGAALDAGVSYGFPVTEDLKLIPALALALRRVDEGLRREDHADYDVYSPYGRTRPATYDALLTALHQPWVDSKMSYRARARFGPQFGGVDRVDGRARFTAVALRDYFPWLGTDFELSYRPVSPQRTLSYVRAEVSPSVSFWYWANASGRFVLSGVFSYSEDFPRSPGRGTELSGQLGLRYDMTWLRGLSDLSAEDRPFQDGLEEGAAPPHRALGPRDPYWREPP